LKKRQKFRDMNYKILFAGSGEFAAGVFKKIAGSKFGPMAVITQPDKPVGRHQTLSPSPVKTEAQKLDFKIYEPKSLKNPESEKMIKELEPDLLVVADYGKIIPKNILDIPKFGALNIHPSLLPRHRGAAPIQYTILEGDEKTGVTIILMDEEVDHGPIVAVSNLEDEILTLTHTELSKKLSELGGELLVEILPEWFDREIEPALQDESQATFTKILTREDGKIDWQKTAEEIDQQIRALEGWPGTWCLWSKENKKIKILSAEIYKNGPSGSAGQVLISPEGKMLVAAGKGELVINELQLEGKNKTTGVEFLRGYPEISKAILS
jgi:methionyl-tRNA formyltransferase